MRGRADSFFCRVWALPGGTRGVLSRCRGRTAWRLRNGEASDECGEGVTPDPHFLAGRHQPAQFHRCESLAERMKLAGGLSYRAAAEKAGALDACHPRLEAGECLCRGLGEVACQLGWAQRLLHADPE